VCLGTVLPEERLPVAAARTGKGLAGGDERGANWAIRLAEQSSPTPAPTPQWQVIEQITVADVRMAAHD
jgi:hypothetical protein